jgi:hypothetical protein
MSSIKVLTESDLRAAAPSIFSESPHSSRSARYAHVPTIDILERMRKAGYVPVHAHQSAVRKGKEDRFNFTRHLIRMRQRQYLDPMVKDDVVPEILLLNAHDGTSSFRLDAGLFRMVCSNGLIVKSADYGSVRLHHTGSALIDAVRSAADEMSEQLPKIIRVTKEWDKIKMTPAARTRLANKALALRYNDNSPLTAAQVLAPRRNADEAPTLWRTFNILQENLSIGGLVGKSVTGRNINTRSIKSVNNILHFNRGLWEMAEAIAG